MRYDLIIVGGGLVGASLAVALRDKPLSIALIDARLPSNADPRLFAMNDSSCQFLKNIGIWSSLAAHAVPIHKVHVSNQGQFGSVRLNRSDFDVAALGHVIPAYHVESVLNDALTSSPSVTLYRPAILKTLTQAEGTASLVIEMANQELMLQSSLVIAADGAGSTVRQQLNIKTKEVDYQQTAIVTRTTLSRSHQHIAYERFNQHGAIAMLPLVENECATIWTADNKLATVLLALSETDFLTALQKEFGYRLGRLQKISKRYQFPLKLIEAKKNFEGCVFLLGNSAHAMHPIAAQGFNLALYEVAIFVEALNEIRSDAIDLQSIHKRISPHQTTSVQMSHKLAHIFSHPNALKSWLLPIGMVGLDICVPIKRNFIAKMIGHSNNTPFLLRNQSSLSHDS